MTALGICQTRPNSPSGAVNWASAKPCADCWLRMASTSHSASDNSGGGGSAFMELRVGEHRPPPGHRPPLRHTSAFCGKDTYLRLMSGYVVLRSATYLAH